MRRFRKLCLRNSCNSLCIHDEKASAFGHPFSDLVGRNMLIEFVKLQISRPGSI